MQSSAAFRAVLLVVGIVLFSGLLHWCAPAQADGEGSLADWYRSLQVPGSGMSCCSEADCKRLKPSEYRTTTEGYEVLISGQWLKVPPEAILQNKVNPTGDPVVCYMGRILCFVRPAEA